MMNIESVDVAISETEDLIRRANEAFRARKYALATELIRQAREIVGRTDSEMYRGAPCQS